MNKDPYKENYFERETEFFQKVDRIITGNTKITVNNIAPYANRGQSRMGVSSNNIAVANLQNKSIWINFKKIFEEINPDPEDKNLFIALSKGFNYHELAHIKHSKILSIQCPGSTEIMNILNALEDGRIETLFSKRYPRTKKYFELCVMNAIQKNAKQLDPVTTFLSIWSRKLILPVTITSYWEESFKQHMKEEQEPKITVEVKKLIDEYQTTDGSSQVDIARKIYDLIYPKIKDNPDTMNSLRIFLSSDIKSMFNNNSNAIQSLSDEEKQEINELRKAINEFNKHNSITLSKEMIEEIKNNTKINDEINKLKQKKDLRTRNHDNNKSDISKELLNKANLETNLKRTIEERKKQDTKTLEQTEKELTEQINLSKKKIEEKATNNQKIIDEVRKLNEQIERKQDKKNQKEINKETNKNLSSTKEKATEESSEETKNIYCEAGSGASARTETEKATNSINLIIKPKHAVISKKLQESIRKIRNDLTKGYIGGQRSGKVNVRNAMNWKQNGNTRIFDRYEPDKRGKTRIGVITLLDSSGSMEGQLYIDALEITYVLQDAMTKTDNPNMIISYNDDYEIIKSFKGKPNFSRSAVGGTELTGALIESKKQIKSYRKTEKISNWILFIITDGRWEDQLRAEGIIRNLNEAKVETTIINLLRNGAHNLGSHQCKHTANIKITNMNEEMPLILKKTIDKIQKNIYEEIKKNGGTTR